MNALKWSSQYVEGVKNFMKFVEEKMGSDCDIQCPCIDCLNVYKQSQNVVYKHLLIRGIDRFYIQWIHHGEQFDHNNASHIDANEGSDDIDESNMSSNNEDDDGINDLLGDFLNNLDRNCYDFLNDQDERAMIVMS